METVFMFTMGALLPLVLITVLLGIAALVLTYMSHRKLSSHLLSSLNKARREIAEIAATPAQTRGASASPAMSKAAKAKAARARKAQAAKARKAKAAKAKKDKALKRRNVVLKTPEELAQRAEALSELADIMETLDCDWQISGGTALGIVREGDFIPWDWDVGIAVKKEQFVNFWPQLVSKAQQKGFVITLVRTETTENNEKVLMTKYGQEFEVLSWTLVDDYRVRKIFRRPARFFDKTEYRELRGRQYPLPSPVEEYLEEVYGDWRTPVRTYKKDVYFNQKNIMNRPGGLATLPGVASAETPVGEPVQPMTLTAPDGEADDLQQITGIGPVMETKLNEAGIYHLHQIASWTPEEAAWMDTAIDAAGRVTRDDWVGQARALTQPEAADMQEDAQDATETDMQADMAAETESVAETAAEGAEAEPDTPETEENPDRVVTPISSHTAYPGATGTTGQGSNS
ncbi:MAG: LicD family protein [Natronohydrobacter sp.]|nr:LicD family protein [Natronohydrobacter sp.]